MRLKSRKVKLQQTGALHHHMGLAKRVAAKIQSACVWCAFGSHKLRRGRVNGSAERARDKTLGVSRRYACARGVLLCAK